MRLRFISAHRAALVRSLVYVAIATGCGARQETSPTTAVHAETHAQPLAELLGPSRASLPEQGLLAIARYLRALESDPTPVLGNAASTAELRDRTQFTLLMRWLVDSPDVHVTLSEWVSPFLALDAILGVAPLFGMSAYLIEHRRANLDPRSAAVQIAGAEFALHWYESLLRRGAAHNASIDQR